MLFTAATPSATNMFKESRDADKLIQAKMSAHLANAVTAGVNDAMTHVAVDTGRLRGTIRQTDVEVEKDSMQCSMVAGGGVVDYAYEQELLSPYLRPAMMAIAEAMRSDV